MYIYVCVYIGVLGGEWSGRLEAWEGWQDVVAGNRGQEGSGGGSEGDVLKGTRDLEARILIHYTTALVAH
jgi:hypothetical protein